MMKCLILVMLATTAFAGCPFANKPDPHPPQKMDEKYAQAYVEAAKKLDWAAVKADIRALLTNSQSFWPADYGNYGPFFVRQAWHCSGSYRTSDGLGGCEGGRQRFNPELSWADNTNLDKAKRLLLPIKEKYGLGLSWGDLMIFTADTAIESMGGPVLGFCGGRIDDPDGSWSKLLGPTKDQQANSPCATNGKCTHPFGTTTIGLIYVNPEGPMADYTRPDLSAQEVNATFGAMGMDAVETVALIGGGHAFGKTHGACPTGPGPSPKEDPANPWPGTCANGSFTSGFEGAWSFTPTQWGNGYFTNLLSLEWAAAKGPGGHYQYYAKGKPGVMMLTSDISLTKDPLYNTLANRYASNLTYLNEKFMNAWYKLTTRDMGPRERCLGPNVPPAQKFQHPLPPAPSPLPDFTQVSAAIRKVMNTASSAINPDYVNGNAYYGALFVHVAYQCATTFRKSDYLGGCNGARIRFPPQSNWPANEGVNQVLQVLQPVKTQFGASLSWADLIVLAGNVALSDASGLTFPFCGGRADATEGYADGLLQPNGEMGPTCQLRYDATMLGLDDFEYVALAGRLRSPSQMRRQGYGNASYTSTTNVLNNQYFSVLLNNEWNATRNPISRKSEYTSGSLVMTPFDISIRLNPILRDIAEGYAQDQGFFIASFLDAWTKLMNADRFKDPINKVCPNSNFRGEYIKKVHKFQK
eukprot:PhF_6_TR34138/c0_g1_i1/m.49854/K03782/katG; catalase-peroxidase